MFSYDFEWSVLWRHPYGQWMLQGIWTTITLSSLAFLIAVTLGLMVGVFRVLPNRITRFIGGSYVELIRNTPYLVQLFFWYFGVPSLLPKMGELWLYDHVPGLPYWTGVVCLGVYTASRVGEQIRAGMLSIPTDQYQAAFSTGLTTSQTYRYVIIPYAIRIIIPPFTTEFLTCFKNSALTMTIGVLETTGASYLIDSYTWHGLETTTAASVVYIVITLCVVMFMAWVEKRIHIPGMIARGR
jgi:glutamate/aspartate transport system permease protein